MTAKKKASKKPAPRQKSLPGTLPPRIVAVETAAQSYIEHDEEHKTVKESLGLAKDALISAMHGAGIASYNRGGFKIELETADKLKVKRTVYSEE